MGWAEKRIRDIHAGGPASWLERRMLEHANPVHFFLSLIASIGFVFGLWNHAEGWIVGSMALALAGHAYCWTRGKPDLRL